MKKRGQIDTKILIYALGAIIAFVIILVGVRSCSSLTETSRDVILNRFALDIKGNLELMSVPGQDGSIINAKLDLPPGTAEICMVDLDHTKDILRSGLLSTYPLIIDALDSSIEDNVFILDSKRDILKTIKADDLCFQRYPYFLCTPTPRETLDILIQGRGDCAEVLFNWSSIESDNVRDMTKYDNNPLFLIPDIQIDNERINTNDILRLVPLSLWRNMDEELELYPYIVYFTGTGTFDTTAKINIMNSAYGDEVANVSYLFSDPLDTEILDSEKVIVKFNDDNISDFWEELNDVVVIDPDNTDGALIASLFAAYMNAPLLFVDNENLIDFKGIMNNKRVFTVDSLGDDVEFYLLGDYDDEGNAAEVVSMTTDGLIYGYKASVEDTFLNPFKQLASSISIS